MILVEAVRPDNGWARPDGCYKIGVLDTCYGWETNLALNHLIMYFK